MRTSCFQHDSFQPYCADCESMNEKALKIGDVVPHVLKRMSLGPTFTGPGKTSFKPARNGRK